MGATTLGGSAAEAATSGGIGVDTRTGEASGAESWIGEASGVQCAAHMLKMATAIMDTAADSGMPAGLESEETTGMSATRTDISDGSNTLVISLLSPDPSSASAGVWVLCPPPKKILWGNFGDSRGMAKLRRGGHLGRGLRRGGHLGRGLRRGGHLGRGLRRGGHLG